MSLRTEFSAVRTSSCMAIAAALAAATPVAAHAQDTSASDQGDASLNNGAIIVTGFRASLESAVNYLDVADASSDNPGITALRVVDTRANTSFRYGQLNSPFEYEKIRYFYHESRKLKIAD